jgi:hypothetical protein
LDVDNVDRLRGCPGETQGALACPKGHVRRVPRQSTARSRQEANGSQNGQPNMTEGAAGAPE